MAKSLAEFIRTALDEDPDPSDWYLRGIECIHIRQAAITCKLWEKVQEPNPPHYLDRMRMHMEKMVPQDIERLRTEPWLADVDFIVMFILWGSPCVGWSPAKFIKPFELGRLRKEAHLRSAQYALANISKLPPSAVDAILSTALMAGVRAKSIEITRARALESVRSYLGKGNPARQETWNAARMLIGNLNSQFNPKRNVVAAAH